jgi:hypothetical protein
MSTFRSLSAFVLLTAWMSAQTVTIGGTGALGCQNPGNPPTLSDGTFANATVNYSYDANLALLTLVVENTTVADVGNKTPLITVVGFNAPASVTNLQLLFQSGTSGAAPAWNMSAGPSAMGCFGNFTRTLQNAGGLNNGIGKAGANNAGAAGAAVIGPVTFVIGVTTAATLTTQDFLDALSTNPPGSFNVSTAARFQGSGPNGDGSGTIGAADECTELAISQDLGGACGLALDPVLSANPPVIGTNWTLSLNSDPAFGASLGFWFLSFPPVQTYTVPGINCNIYVDILNPNNFFLVTMFFTDANGDWSITVPLPDLQALVGLDLIMQIRLCSPNGPQGPLQPDWLSNGLRVKIGCL